MSGGGKIVKKYADDQRHAAGKCALDLNLSAKEAAAYLEQHGYDNVDPFKMGHDTVGICKRRERERRAGQRIDDTTPIEQQIDLEMREQLASIRHWSEQLRRRITQGKATAKDADLGKRLSSWLREIRSLERGISPSSGTGRGARKPEAAPPPERRQKPPKGNDLRERMELELRKAHDQANGNTHTHSASPHHDTKDTERQESEAKPPDRAVHPEPEAPEHGQPPAFARGGAPG